MLSIMEGDRVKVKSLKSLRQIIWNKSGVVERWTTADLYEVRLDYLPDKLFLLKTNEIEKEVI